MVTDVCKRFRDRNVQYKLDSIRAGKFKDNRNQRLANLPDSSKFIHRVLWGSDIKWLFLELDGKVSKWTMEEQDSVGEKKAISTQSIVLLSCPFI